MRADRYTRYGLALAATAALLAMTAYAAAAAAAPAGAHRAGGEAATPGWRVVKTTGTATGNVSGLLAADSAKDAWSVWTGPGLTSIVRSAGTAWTRVPLPATLDPYVRTAVTIGASSSSDFWLFGTYRTTDALRWTGAAWVREPIPSWVLRASSGTVSAASAVFGPRNVWVFSLGAGAYAAHYDGHTWAKTRLPAVPLEVSVAGPDDIWALGPNLSFVMHWNGQHWDTIGVPLPPLPKGATLSYSDMTAVGPKDAWLFRSITLPSSPLPVTAMLHWTGTAWLTLASPADIVGSLMPDGNGGLWADGIDINPGGFWLFYHLAGGHWTQFTPPGVDVHSPESLTWIPGTRSLWATGSAFTPVGDHYGVILKYGR